MGQNQISKLNRKTTENIPIIPALGILIYFINSR
jgi:hypothetical protein